MARLPGLRPPGSRAGYGGLSTGLPALTTNWLASTQATLRAFPPPTRRAIGDLESGRATPKAKSKAKYDLPSRGWQAALGFVQARSARDEQRSCSSLRLLTFWGPCAAVRVGRSGPPGGSTGTSIPFRQGRMPCRKARPALTDLPSYRLGKRQAGCPSLWLLSLGHARESNPASGRRTEACRRRARSRQRQNRANEAGITSKKEQRHKAREDPADSPQTKTATHQNRIAPPQPPAALPLFNNSSICSGVT